MNEVFLGKRINFGSSYGVPFSPEFRRIRDLPRRALDFGNIPDLTPLFIRDPSPCQGCFLCAKGPPKLFPLQSAALLEAEAAGGLFAPLPVGSGKTLISLLLPEALQSERAVIIIPPQLKRQLLDFDIRLFDKHFKIPFDRIAGIVSYSELSSPRQRGLLDGLAPDHIILDEAHSLRNPYAVRTERFKDYLLRHPECEVSAMSGTMTKFSIKDYAHLMTWALKDSAPIPSKWSVLRDWAEALDVPEFGDTKPPGVLLDLCTSSETPREGYGRRMRETSGVVSPNMKSIDCGLVYNSLRPKVPGVISQKLIELDKTWELGEEVYTEALAVARAQRQISLGFYYVWDWPDGVIDREWLDARRDWTKEVREFLHKGYDPRLDSPSLLAHAARKSPCSECSKRAVCDTCGKWQSLTWAAWAEVKDRPTPPTKAIWLDDFVIREVTKWAEEGGIIWTSHTTVGHAISKALGLPFFGPGSDHDLLEACKDPPKTLIASVHVHKQGKNLQYAWNRNLIVYPFSNGITWEQCIGRTHRTGQKADEVTVDVFTHTAPLRANWARALVSANYVQETYQTPQKLMYGTKIGFDTLDD